MTMVAMLGRRKKVPEVVGIHVGRSALTVVRTGLGPDRVELRQLFHAPLPRAFAAWPTETARSVLQEARKAVNLKVDTVRLTLCGDLAPAHFFMLPSSPDRGELDKTIKQQLADKWGQQAGELVSRHVTLETRGDRSRVCCISIPLERLRLILASLAEIGCLVDSVESECVTVSNLVGGRSDNGSPIGVLNLSPAWGEIHVVRRDRIALSRSICRADDKGNGSGAEDALDWTAPPPGGEASVAHGALGHLCVEANKTLDYFELELMAPAVRRVFLIGEAANTPQLADTLSDQLDLTVEAFESGESLEDRTGAYAPTLHSLAVAAATGEGRAL
jgi:hypothetical protein